MNPENTLAPLQWHTPDCRHQAAHHHPALLIELARARALPDHRLLRHTGLFMAEILQGDVRISDSQYRRLMQSVQSEKPDAELALLWGRQFFPGHYGTLSTLIQHSPNLQQALECIHQYRQRLCPLVSPRWLTDGKWSYLLWIDSGGAGTARRFAATAIMAALYGLFRHRADMTPQWHFHFAGEPLGSTADYRVSLGEKVWFNTGADIMVLPTEDLFRPWPDSSETAFTVARHQIQSARQGSVQAPGFPEVIYRFLMRTIEQPVTLESAAAAFGMSPSSFKRRLSACETSFRTLLDEARFHYTLYLSRVRQHSTDSIAERLSNGDRTNFRRSFRRWSGMTLAEYRACLDPEH